MSHAILLGDSIFDNSSYVPGEPPVIQQLRAFLPSGWKATLLAVDGAITGGVAAQLARLPADASHLVVSVGGNDALANSHIVHETVMSAAEGFAALADVQDRFRQDYRAMLQAVCATGKPVVLCTIYDSVPGLPRASAAALATFNDVIVREGVRRGLPVLDLRLLCDEAADYSRISPIEPSRQGGEKIARALARILTGHDFARAEAVVYGK